MKKRATKKNIDPFLAREAQKYRNPIPSREFIMQRLEDLGAPEKFQNLLQSLGLKTADSQEALRKRLNAMLRDGQIITDRRGRFALVRKMNLIKGQIVSHRDGYGFLVPDDNSEDLFLSPKQMRTLFPGDQVLASVILEKESGKREGAVVEVLSRNFTHIIGRYEVLRGVGFVIPAHRNLNSEIVIPNSKKHKAKKGDIVLVEIMSYPTGRYSATAKIVKILDKEVTPSLEIDIVANAYGLPSDWSKQIIKESKELAKLKINTNKRVDLRELSFVTIDGKNAKDFDDAVYCEKHGDGWILYVAIADVSHYVGIGSFIDQEAFKRGNSVYFPNQVIPMLPEVLSNDLCSLKPLRDRPAMICEIRIDSVGRAISHKFYEAIIKSQARLIYDEVYELLEKKPSSKHRLLPQLLNLRSLYQALLRQRKARGTLDFSRREVEIIFTDDGKISKIIEVTGHYVHGMIEEFMLLANVCASKFLLQHKIPALYRVHEAPDQEKLTKLRAFLKNMGLELSGGKKPKAIHYAQLMEKIVGRKEEHFIQMVILRSLKQAGYAYINVGHFGLAYEEYTHFTSPIRRYSDLINHRAIKYLLHGKAVAKYHYGQEDMQNLASHCSFTERRADDASRDVELWHRCQFMRDKIGDTFDGVISGVMNFGLFVELKGIFVEGLVHITSLKSDYYQFDPLLQKLVGKRSGKSYCLGDSIRVLVSRVDIDDLEISLELI